MGIDFGPSPCVGLKPAGPDSVFQSAATRRKRFVVESVRWRGLLCLKFPSRPLNAGLHQEVGILWSFATSHEQEVETQ
jgi:hypothetical protein